MKFFIIYYKIFITLLLLFIVPEKPVQSEEAAPKEVKVRSTVAEEFSPVLLVSKPDELVLLETFMKNKVELTSGIVISMFL